MTNSSRTQIETHISELCDRLMLGLIAYERQDDGIHIFHSNQMGILLDTMVPDAKITDISGQKWIVTSPKPFICGGEMCIRACRECDSCGGKISSGDAIACKFFVV